MKWDKRKDAPIPDYTSGGGRFRLYRGNAGAWVLQDRLLDRGTSAGEWFPSMRDAQKVAEKKISESP